MYVGGGIAVPVRIKQALDTLAYRQWYRSATHQPSEADHSCRISHSERRMSTARVARGGRACLLLAQGIADLVEKGVAGAGLVVVGAAACTRPRR
jgi:hypothetical protein